MSDPIERQARLAQLDAACAAECAWRQAAKRFAASRGLSLDMGNVERAIQDIYTQADEARR